jgi:hypothetical protein
VVSGRWSDANYREKVLLVGTSRRPPTTAHQPPLKTFLNFLKLPENTIRLYPRSYYPEYIGELIIVTKESFIEIQQHKVIYEELV